MRGLQRAIPLLLLRLPLLALLTSSIVAQARGATETLQLAWVFADHMVLQRDRPIPVWGTAPSGAEVHVSLGKSRAVTEATVRGQWRVDLPSQSSSTVGRELVVSTAEAEIRVRDVLIGEVWLCAGQSNMDFPLSRSVGGAEAAAGLSRSVPLRLCNRSGVSGGGARPLSAEALSNITPESFYSGTWRVASTESSAAFSAVGFYFGQRLRTELDVPVGLIDVSVGGSTTEGWIPRARLAAEETLAPLTSDFLATHLSHPFIRERAEAHLGDWVAAGRPEPRPRHFFEPGFLFDSAIAELAPFHLRGVLWYQGESNAHSPRLAGSLFRALVEEWRALWALPKMPFFFVQLPSMGRSTWPEFREEQASWLDLPDTGMAVAIDVGHPEDVHPRHKKPVGERLALLALADTYGRKVAAHGPAPISVTRMGRQLAIQFEHAKGLAWAAGRGPTGFELCGADRRFYPAEARLEGDRLVLTAPEVKAPRDARYAWAPVPEWSLVNGAGLPAAPFRTHAWRPIRVACIGDSITAGVGLGVPDADSYPARLQHRLGDGYHVENFGRPGACVVESTMKGSLPRAYRRNEEHMAALCFEPHVVISNLGINDIMAWPKAGEAFVGDYEALVEEYRALDSDPAVLLWTPLTPLFEGHGYFGSPHIEAIHRAIATVAHGTRSAQIDLSGPLRGRAEWFPDHIHPSAKGADVAASVVFDALMKEGLVVK